MKDGVLEVVLRRDRILIVAALAAITVLAWGYVLWLAADMNMGGVGAPGSRMIPAGIGLMAPSLVPWRWFEFVLVLLMWIVMMIGMMIPSAAPMILIYARVARMGATPQAPFASGTWFLAGYLLIWSAFSIAATVAQWALERADLLDSRMAENSRILGAIILIAVGVYQWTALKQRCLQGCQAPLTFIQRQGGFRRDARGALLVGLKHGAYCLGCCWILMSLLFVGGVMNLLWIAAIAFFILAEKLSPPGWHISRVSGLGFIAAGGWILLRPVM